MAKHKLNYTIIREALGEYLNNNSVIPMYNKKQIKEEAYKLEDLENSKAFILDNITRKRMRVDLMLTKGVLYDMFINFLSKTNEYSYLASGRSYSGENKKEYEMVEAYVQLEDKQTQEYKLNSIVDLISSILQTGPLRENITKEHINKLKNSVERLPINE